MNFFGEPNKFHEFHERANQSAQSFHETHEIYLASRDYSVPRLDSDSSLQ
jgi:hypothetical protein